jgi:hypothetical protein
MGLRRYQSSGATKFLLYHPHFVAVKAAAQQGECRIAKKIFRYNEVFNTTVDKYVENARPGRLTSRSSTFLHSLHNIGATESAFQVGKKTRKRMQRQKSCPSVQDRTASSSRSRVAAEIFSSTLEFFRFSTPLLV